MQSQLAAGDEVQTVGGLYATVTAVDDESVTVEAAPGVHLRYARGAIARVTKPSAKPTTRQTTSTAPTREGHRTGLALPAGSVGSPPRVVA